MRTEPALTRAMLDAWIWSLDNLKPTERLLALALASHWMPSNRKIYPSIPNPAGPSTTIRFDLNRPYEKVVLAVYDPAGRRVRTLADGPLGMGRHALKWNGLDDGGLAVASGVYFYRLTVGAETLTQKLTLLR